MQNAEGRDEELLAMIRRHEGEVTASTGRHVAYDDGSALPIKPGTHVSGHPTIGYGRLLSAGRGLSDSEAEYLLNNDLADVCAGLDRDLPWWRDLPRKPRMALADMAFNLGVPGLMQFDRMLTALRSGDYATAASEALNSLWASQVGQRAQTDAQLIRSGDR